MSELYVFCEGRTEQNFCKQVLVPALRNFDAIHPIRIAFGKSKGITYRGGIRRYAPARNDIMNTLAQRKQADVFFTTMFDLYKLPKSFPGNDAASRDQSPAHRVRRLEKAFAADISDRRFTPYIQLHEYETLLFADLDALQIAFDDCGDAIVNLKADRRSFNSIEEINDTPTGAPSKRIIREVKAYRSEKAIAGADIAEFIGMDSLRSESPHFHQWISALEQL